MTFDPNIPTIPSSPYTSSSPIQVNFAQFASIFSNALGGVVYNHFPLTGNSKQQGKHGAVLMENQASDPGVTGDYAVLFNKNATSATSTEPQLFSQILKFLPTSQDTTLFDNPGVQLTHNTINNTNPALPYYSFLPGGYLLYFGTTTRNGAPFTLTPTPTKILCVEVYPTATGTIPPGPSIPSQNNVPFDTSVVIIQPNTITITSNRATPLSPFLYLAIAKA